METLWTLRCQTHCYAVCRLAGAAANWTVTVAYGPETVLSAHFEGRDEAVQLAHQLELGLINKGWMHATIERV